LLITDPQSLDPRSGNLAPALALQVHKKGMSVLRECAANTEFERTFSLLRQASDAKGKERFFHGVCEFTAGKLRYHDGIRFLGVYDTGLSDRPHHADVMGPPIMDRKEQERCRKVIIDKIGSSFVGVAKFRDGAFLKHGRP
jgi:hypothetical protein